MALVQSLLSSSKYSLKCPYTMTPIGVAVHNTANDAPAKNEVSYMKSNNNSTSFHVAVDDVEAIQVIPFNRNAFAAGDGKNGEGNRKYIHFEICYSKSGGTKFTNAEKRAAKEIAVILKQFGWGINKVKKHQDFSGKYCPHRTLDLGWSRFTKMIQTELDALNGASSSNSTNTSTSLKIGDKVIVSKTAETYATGQTMASFVKGSTYTVKEVRTDRSLLSEISSWVYNKDLTLVGSTNTSYAVKITADSLNVRSGPGTNYSVTATVKKGEVYTIVEENNGWGKLKSGAGWISLSYTTKA